MHPFVPKAIAKRYDPANLCIYCGADRYVPGHNRGLTIEHIIPFGLNGELTLPRASCRRCEGVTGSDEQILLRGVLLGCRTLLGLRTRKPKDRPNRLPLFDTEMTPNRKIMVDVEHYPANILLIKNGPPPILSGQPASQIGPWCCFFRNSSQIFRSRYGIASYATPLLDTKTFNRVLGKVGHSFAVAELGRSGFHALLPHYIRDPDGDLSFFVGGASHTESPSTSLHEIDFEPPSAEHSYIVVRVRLFSFLGAPIYRVVIGIRDA